MFGHAARLSLLLFSFMMATHALNAEGELLLKNNMEKAKNGDYLVIAQGKTYTLFHIFDVKNKVLTIEEVSIPSQTACQVVTSWRGWFEESAPKNTSWVIYQIDLNSGEMKNYFSFTKNGWYIIPEAENFLKTLLDLPLTPIPVVERRKIGNRPSGGAFDKRKLWQPKMVVEGEVKAGTEFDAYTTEWPRDGGPLSGKSIEIFLPKDTGLYPSYFPYWLQVKGVLGPARVRIIDSGSSLKSPKSGYP